MFSSSSMTVKRNKIWTNPAKTFKEHFWQFSKKNFATLVKIAGRILYRSRCTDWAMRAHLNPNFLLVAQPVKVEVNGALVRAEVGKVLIGLVAPAALVRLDPLVPVLVVGHLLLVHEALWLGEWQNLCFYLWKTINRLKDCTKIRGNFFLLNKLVFFTSFNRLNIPIWLDEGIGQVWSSALASEEGGTQVAGN